jgi:hypothetical protein
MGPSGKAGLVAGGGAAPITAAATGDSGVGRGVGLASSTGVAVGGETVGAGVCPHAAAANIIITANREHILYIIDSFLSTVSDTNSAFRQRIFL